MTMNIHNPAHPGEILREWIDGLDVANQGEVAEALGINRVTLSRIVNGHAGVSADIDVRLSTVLGTSPGFWLALQSQFDLAIAMRNQRKLQLKRLVKPVVVAKKESVRRASAAA
jgi:addiction module HigA family antidote